MLVGKLALQYLVGRVMSSMESPVYSASETESATMFHYVERESGCWTRRCIYKILIKLHFNERQINNTK